MLHRRLFREDPFEDLEERKEERLGSVSHTYINSAIDKLPEISEEEFVEITMREVGFNIPSFDYDKLRKEKQGSPGNESLRMKLLVSGNEDLLDLPPLDEDISPVDIDNVNGPWLEWTVSIEDKSGEEVSEEIEEKLEAMQTGLDGLKPRLEAANDDIEERARKEYRERMEKFEKNEETIENIDIQMPDENNDS